MDKLIIFIVLIALYSCTDSSPDCIEDMIMEFEEENEGRGFTFIYQFERGGERYHIFDSGIAFDATASVVNESCEVVCTYGGFRVSPMPCDDFLEDINNARQIWPE